MQLSGRRAATWLLLATAALGITFIVMHGFEYVAEYHEGLIPGIRYTQHGPHAAAMQLVFCLYYFITGFHGLQVSIGVGLLLTMAWRTHRGALDQD